MADGAKSLYNVHQHALLITKIPRTDRIGVKKINWRDGHLCDFDDRAVPFQCLVTKMDLFLVRAYSVSS
jgi:hypothetical protein